MSLLDAAPDPPDLPEPVRAVAPGSGDGAASGRPTALLAAPPRRSPKPWRVAVPAALVTLALIGGAVVLIQSERPSDDVTAGGSAATAPFVLIPIDQALAASAPFDGIADVYRDAYASGESAAVLALLDDDASRADAVFPSVLPTKQTITSVLFPDPSFEADCAYRSRFSGAGEGLYLAACPERFEYEFPADDPLTEVSYWELGAGGLISGWTLHYGLDALDRLPDPGFRRGLSAEVEAARTLLAGYAAAWSSGDVDRIASLYAPRAQREDSLLGTLHIGSEAIGARAAEFRSWYPDASWALVGGYSNADGFIGGFYEISTPDPDGGLCEVRLATRLRVVDGFIDHDAVFYDVESLVSCGWAA
jgi:hypothetical protein